MDRIVILIVGIAISIVAAWYSIAGLTAIFAAAVIPIIIMGGVLEIGKIVTASWMFRNWKNIPFLMRTYFSFAVLVLMLITSMGIFGFLSKAHIDQTVSSGDNTLQIGVLNQRIEREQNKLNDANRVIVQLDKSVDALIKYDRIRGKDGAIAVRKSQTEERNTLNAIIESTAKEITKLRQEKLKLSKQQLKFEAEVGPIKYIADMIYGDQAKSMMDKAVRAVILLIVVVFDPLAILLIVAAGGINVSNRKIVGNGETKQADITSEEEVKNIESVSSGRNKRRMRKGTERWREDSAEIVNGDDWTTSEKVIIKKEEK